LKADTRSEYEKRASLKEAALDSKQDTLDRAALS
jgi:hypothetical protein